MVVLLKPDAPESGVQALLLRLSEAGLDTREVSYAGRRLLLLSGATHLLDAGSVLASGAAEKVLPLSENYVLASRKIHPEDTVIPVGEEKIGSSFQFIAGPCMVEGEEEIFAAARAVKAAGATMLRAGAYKPRTSPYSPQGLDGEGLKFLLAAAREVGLPVVTELTDVRALDRFSEVDVIQVGARNMQNFELLKELSRSGKPILLKRGFANTVNELLLSAEYLLLGGNTNVILCERGVRTFETAARATFDVSAIALLKEKTHLPVLADPSHAAGISSLVPPLARAACAAGADGLLIEVHPAPERARCDGAQAITPGTFSSLVKDVRAIRNALGK